MTYQCIPLSTKEYNRVLGRVLEHPNKAKKYNHFSEKYKSVTKAIKALESSDPDEQMAKIRLIPDAFHGDWNYTIRPTKC